MWQLASSEPGGTGSKDQQDTSRGESIFLCCGIRQCGLQPITQLQAELWTSSKTSHQGMARNSYISGGKH